jgi:hypothetical protein
MKIILLFPDVYLLFFSGYAQNDYPEPAKQQPDYFIFNIVTIIIHTFMMQI